MQRGKELKWERETFELQPSRISFKTKEYGRSTGNSSVFTFRSAIISQPKLITNESHGHLQPVFWQTGLANIFVVAVLFLAVTIDTN